LQNEKFEVVLLVILLFSAITNGGLLPTKSLGLKEIHLVRCLTYISQRYFPPERSVVISSPSTYRHVQQELIAEIQRNFNWPLVVTVDGNISIPDEKDIVDREGSYIILVPDGNIKTLKAKINGLAQEGEYNFTSVWNSEARFVVAGANIFTMSQQKDMFNYFSKLRIYNCIMVSQELYATDKENSKPIHFNGVDTGVKLGVYTWFPYQSSNSCTEVNDITLLDSWVISAQGHFTKNTDLFPRKIRKRFNGCPMKAVVRDGRGFVATYYVKGKKSSGIDVRGFEMDLLRIILKQMNMTFVHVPTPKGFELGKDSVNNLVSVMIAKEAYIALGRVTRNLSLYNFFDLTNSYLTTRMRWYVPCAVKYQRWSSIFRILSAELWIILIISIVFAAISTTVFGQYSCTSELQVYKTLLSSLTNVWAVILGVSVSTMPRTPSLRSLFLAWVCFSLAFSTVFQAFLTSFLTDTGYKPPIQNMDELLASGIKLAYIPEYDSFIQIGDETKVSKIRRNLVSCPSYKVCSEWARYHKNISILFFDSNAEFLYATGDYIDENSKPMVCSLEDGVIIPYSQTMMMLHGDPLMKRVNGIVDRVVEAGLYNHWISLFFNEFKLISRKIGIVQPLDDYYSFNLYHMQTAFYFLLMGWCLSALCFIFEVLCNRVLSRML